MPVLESRESALHRSRLRGAAKSTRSNGRRAELRAQAETLDAKVKASDADFFVTPFLFSSKNEVREQVALQVSEHTEYAHRLLAEEE